MDYIDESDVVVHCEAYTAMYLRENRFHQCHSCFRTCCFAERQLYMTLELGLKLGRTF